MRASGIPAHVTSHLEAFSSTRWIGSRDTQDFDSFLSDVAGLWKGASASTTAGAATTSAATTSDGTASSDTSSAGQSETAAGTTTDTQAQAGFSTAQTTATSATDSGAGAAGASGSTGGPGLTNADGAPLIIPNTVPSPGSYTGPAAYNPYYWTVNCPYKAGNVAGFSKWFQTIQVGSEETGYVDPNWSATLDGGLEALRLVQQFVPDATLQAYTYPGQVAGQPSSYDVKLPDGTLLNGATLLNRYYNYGYGVTQGSDLWLEEAVGLATP
jgi:hypothetical protein